MKDMKMSRRNMLRTIGSVSAIGLPLAEACSARPSNVSDNAASANTIAIQFYKLDAEPLVNSSQPIHDRFNDGLAGQLVVITARKLKPLDWDIQPDRNCWLLRLPEMVYIAHRRFDYQVGMEWRKNGGTWSYTDCPLRNLAGSWRTTEGKLHLAPETEKNVPMIGTMSVDLRSDSLGLHYTLSVKNTSGETWKDVYFWVCLNYYQSRIMGYRSYLRVGNAWLQTQEMPSARCHRYYPTPGMTKEFKRCMADRGEFEGTCTELSFPGVVCWNHTANGPLLVCHFSRDALAAGSNQLWPCTDLHLWFGDLAPGEQKSKVGHLLVAECDLKTFSEYADSITSIWIA